MPLIVEGLSKSMVAPTGGKFALFANFSLKVEDGEFLVLLGKNGVGKTTLLRMLAGLDKPDGGHITLKRDGESTDYVCNSISQTMTNVATLVFQDYNRSLFPWQSGRKALEWAYAGGDEEKESVLTQLMDSLSFHEDGLDEKRPYEMSGGQKQRVALARAFARRPRLLLMDEPFGSLDASWRYRFEVMTRRLWEKWHPKPTILFVTHDVEEAIIIGEQIIILEGRPVMIQENPVRVNIGTDRGLSVRETQQFCTLRRFVRECLHNNGTDEA